MAGVIEAFGVARVVIEPQPAGHVLARVMPLAESVAESVRSPPARI